MSKDAPLTPGQKLHRRWRVLILSLQRFVYHLFGRYRAAPAAFRKTILGFNPDADDGETNIPAAEVSDLQAHSPELERRPDAADVERDLDDADASGEADCLSVHEQAPALCLAGARTEEPEFDETATAASPVALATSPAEDDPAGNWLSEWFGPVSPRRKLWLFVSTTGTLGFVLALILLLNGHKPQHDQQTATIPTKKPASKEAPPVTVEEQDEKPAGGIAFTEPVVETAKPDDSLPEWASTMDEPPVKETPAPNDHFDLQVILLPAPDEENQGELFRVTSDEPVVDADGGFAPPDDAKWQRTVVSDAEDANPWRGIETLVPLYGSVEPQEAVDTPVGTGSLQASFTTTQPEQAVTHLPMTYEMVVTNNGPTPIDRLVVSQTLPESVQPGTIPAMNDRSGRTMRWEFERLAPEDARKIPLSVVPTETGAIVPATSVVATSTISSQTLVQVPQVELLVETEPAAPLHKYQQIKFTIRNTGEVPLNDVVMRVKLSDNLWHRFGRIFEFAHDHLDVGQTRVALLHVRTEKAGPAFLAAQLRTDEGAITGGQHDFYVLAEGQTRPPVANAAARDDQFLQPRTPVEDKTPAPANNRPTRSIVPERKPLPPMNSEEKPTPAPAKVDPFPAFDTPAKKQEAPRFERKSPEPTDDPFGVPKKKAGDGLFGEDSP